MTKPVFSNDQLLALDKKHVWHPYESMINAAPVLPVVSAKGVRLTLATGEELIDGMASWWSAIHGYNHPVLNLAAKNQLDAMSHVMFGGITHPSAVKLATQLVDITPPTLNKVFFSDSGSVSIEVAMKMAIQYWYSIGEKTKYKFLSLRNGYHGDSFAAMSVCDPITGMHHMFNHVLLQNYFAESPSCQFGQSFCEDAITDFKQLLISHHRELAAVILEPIVQGAGGMKFYAAEYLVRVRQLCDEFNVLLICDEIATGFGRTGKLFACEHATIEPDILCVGKSLSAGYLSLAATLCNDKVAMGICEGDAQVFMHGPTFMANPLATAIASASIELLLSQDWQQNIYRIEKQLQHGLEPAKHLDTVADVRILGAIGVIELKEAVNMAHIQKQLLAHGVWLRPFGKLLYTLPPYIINNNDLSTLTDAMIQIAAGS